MFIDLIMYIHTYVSVTSSDEVVIASHGEGVSKATSRAAVREKAVSIVLSISWFVHLLYAELPCERRPIPVPEYGVSDCDCDLIWVPYIPQSVFHAGTVN